MKTETERAKTPMCLWLDIIIDLNTTARDVEKGKEGIEHIMIDLNTTAMDREREKEGIEHIDLNTTALYEAKRNGENRT